MATRTTTVTVCDGCGKECKPVRSVIFHVGQNQPDHRLAVMFYLTSRKADDDLPDVCNACLQASFRDVGNLETHS